MRNVLIRTHFKKTKRLLYTLALVFANAKLDEGDGFMAKIEMQSLNPIKKGGLGTLILAGVGIAIVGVVAFSAMNYLNAGLNEVNKVTGLNLGIPSSIEGSTNGNEVLNTAGALGVGSHPYGTVTFTRAVHDGAGANFSSMTQYVWDAEPQNWGEVLNIADDLTTPKGTQGQTITIPATSTITTGTLTATLNTALGENNKYDSKGNLAVVDKRYWVYASIASAPDLFFTVDVPSAGAVDSASPTVPLSSVVDPRLDTTAWTGSAIDIGLAGTSANTVMYGSATYRIKDQNITQVKSVSITDLNKLGGAGGLDYIKVNFTDLAGGEWMPYNYASGIDEFVYDGSSFDATLLGSTRAPTTGVLATINAGENVNLQVEVKADATGATGLHNGQALGTLVILDIEGNTLVSQNIQG